MRCWRTIVVSILASWLARMSAGRRRSPAVFTLVANHACILPGETKELECRLSDEENTLSGCSVMPALSMVTGLVAPDAVYFTPPDDGICWLRVTNEGAAAMEFDSADDFYRSGLDFGRHAVDGGAPTKT